jgi:hypothetical protein
VEVINDDIAAGKIITKTYSFDQVSLRLYLPKFSSQAARLIGVSLHGTATLTTRDASGNVVSQATSAYAKSWGLLDNHPTGRGSNPIINDYTDLATAP